MKDFGDVLSPKSWLFLVAGFFPMYLIVFLPSITEILVFHLVEFAGIQLTVFWDRRLFLRRFPASKNYFPTLNTDAVNALSLDEKVSLFQSLVRFPLVRATFCSLMSVPKILISSLVVVFFWKHDSSNWMQFGKFIAVEAVMLSYFYGALFIELHDLVSRKISSIHEHNDWTEVFRRVETPSYRGHFEAQERLAFLSAGVFMMWTQWLVIVDQSRSPLWTGVEVVVIGCCAGILMGRMWRLSRNYFFHGLNRIFQVLDTLRPELPPKALPLHSSFLLARFGQVFNQLVERMNRYERELSHWIFIRAEQSRYRALGEISGLIVHDLSGPLHVMQFCSEQLKEHPEKIHDPRYLEQLSTNSSRSLDLVRSLRAYLQNPKQATSQVTYHDVEPHLFRLLEAQYLDKGFSRIRFQIDANARHVSLAVTAADLIHILLNLYANSASNLLQYNISSPTIRLLICEMSESRVTLGIEDNGTGLSKEKFEQLTAFAHLPPTKRVSTYDGLGLRLIRRLVERNNGTLSVVDRGAGATGTLFHLSVDRGTDVAQEEVADEITQAHLDH